LIFKGPGRSSDFQVRYDSHIEEMIVRLSNELPDFATKHPKRGSLLKLLEDNQYFSDQFSDVLRAKAQTEKDHFRAHHGEDIEVHMNRDRYGEAGRIISEVVAPIPRKMSRAEKVSELTLRPWPGLPILALVLLGVFSTVVFVGSALESALVGTYSIISTGFFQSLASFIGGQMGSAIAQGLNLTLMSIVGIVIPYILLFYLVLAVLEDSGYLPRVVVLLDGLMQRMGLSGRAIIPMIVGTGCNVPAILSTRVLGSRRERLILAAVIILAVPCGAQTVVILGTVGAYGGLAYVAVIYAILMALVLLAGWILHRMMKFEPIGLMIEVPDLCVPRLDNVLSKSYHRVKDFFVIAFPILLVTSLILEFLMAYEILNMLVDPFSPLTVGLLGLPAVTIIALIFGVMRKEMSLQLLVVLFGTADFILVMTVDQMFVFALVMATYVPCVSAFSVMNKEFGLKDTLKVSLASVGISFLIGGAANFLLRQF
jgi:ferrous iron transport protein B